MQLSVCTITFKMSPLKADACTAAAAAYIPPHFLQPPHIGLYLIEKVALLQAFYPTANKHQARNSDISSHEAC